MFDYGILGFLSHLSEISYARDNLINDGFGGQALDEATEKLMGFAVKENKPICDKAIIKSPLSSAFGLGFYPEKSENSFEIGIDFCRHFSLLVTSETEEDREIGKRLVQSVLVRLANSTNERNYYWRCASAKEGGMSFGKLNQVIAHDKTVYGGKVITDENDFIKLLSDIGDSLSANIAATNGEDVFEYNTTHADKLPIITLVVFDFSGYSELSLKKIRLLNEKASAGFNLILFDSNDKAADQFDFDYRIELKSRQAAFLKNGTRITVRLQDFCLNSSDVEDLCKTIEIPNSFEDLFGDGFEPFTKYSRDCIEIPFAIENGKVANFRIGGKYSSHALLSGRTGSGKSVALHTVIDMISLHYRPDDVEIWTIDYKAVEFGCYAINKPPHIRVIGQDNSVEFSISLIDLIYKEYSRRKRLFEKNNVKNIGEYRGNFGDYSMTRLLIVIDEFHNLVQAIQGYSDITYKTKLENLLKETRAMGISFFFCSQAVASGLTGLTEAGRNQIGIRICMMQQAKDEITQTLGISMSETDIINEAMQFDKGYAFYNNGEGGRENIRKMRVIYISDEVREKLINSVNRMCGGKFNFEEDEIIYKNSDRYQISDKKAHYLNRLISKKALPISNSEEINIFPAAPVSLENEFNILFTRNSSNNLLVSGADDDMRESVIFMSVCSALANPSIKVVVNILDENSSKSRSLESALRRLKSKRLQFNIGINDVTANMLNYSKLKVEPETSTVNVWYNLNKLKSALAMASEGQEGEDENDMSNSFNVFDDNPLKALDAAIAGASKIPAGQNRTKPNETKSYDGYCSILKKLFEIGPDYGLFNIVVYNTPKNFSKESYLKVSDFDFRIGTQMSVDDSYVMFGSENFAKKANDYTAVCYTGSKNPISIRPYLMPNGKWISDYNEANKIKEEGNDDVR